MKIKEQLEEMFIMQKALNENILKEFGQDAMTEQKLQLAILDELGELTHELKGDWCWWKKTQAPVDKQRVLEELVDVYHFVMTWEMLYIKEIKDILEFYYYSLSTFGQSHNGYPYPLYIIITNVTASGRKLDALLKLTSFLNFTFDEVYQEYLKKNQINYERLKNGY
ncbi:dUTP diphosphatase [Coprobacillus sp. AF33-1AC]|uniref:dUTP diphosphatase n=1 Tax=Coprobacillus sp. AF33-1AC TaxID=2292032 RepID=UPI000E4AB0F6|nr:dUTP diphosphatase [Coprobacillus sp. AF33-1AC]RHM59668.1 hypothetical protein DWZ53_08980 [Coprobacillus sp. AF33-1AC]